MATIEKRGNNSYRFRAFDGAGKLQLQSWKAPADLTPKQLEKELARRVALFEEQVKHGQTAESTMKLSEFYRFWHDNYAVPHLPPKTVFTYSNLWRRVDDQIGHVRVDKLSPSRLQAFYAWLQADAVNAVTGGGLSAKTIHHYHRLISSVLSYAVELQFIPQNPCERVRPPKQTQKEAYSCSPEQVQRMVAALDGEPLQFRTMVLLYLNTGMRKSELHGLQWPDFDFASGVLRVERELQYLPTTGLQLRPPKNAKSIRPVKLPVTMCDLLSIWHKEQRHWQEAMGDRWQEDTPAVLKADWMFTNEFGNPRHPDSFPKRFKQFLARAGFTPEEVAAIHTHTLRHTNASILIAANTNLTTVAKRLGHAQTTTTANIYAHAIRQADEVAAEALDVALHLDSRPTLREVQRA